MLLGKLAKFGSLDDRVGQPGHGMALALGADWGPQSASSNNTRGDYVILLDIPRRLILLGTAGGAGERCEQAQWDGESGVSSILGAAAIMFRALMTSRRSGESPNILAFSLRAIWRVLFRLEVIGQENLSPGGGTEYRCGRSRFLARRADPVLAHGDVGDFRDRAGRSQELAGAALSSICQCACARSRQALDLRALLREARCGRPPVLFLDTRAAVTGQSMASFDVAALIAEMCAATVIASVSPAPSARFSRAYKRPTSAGAWFQRSN